MGTYSVRAKIDQIVTKEVQLLILADSEEEAHEKTLAVLQDYPRPVKVEGVKRVVTNKANYWIPRDIDIVETIKEDAIA